MPTGAMFSTRPCSLSSRGGGTHHRRRYGAAGGYDPFSYGLALPHVFVYPRSRSQRHVDVAMRVHPAPMGR